MMTKGKRSSERNYDELTEAWRNVETKHDAYTIFQEDREAQASEEWIMELQQSFSEAMEQHIRYLSGKAAKEIAVKQELDRQDLAKRDFDKTQKMTDQTFIKRSTVEAVFKPLVERRFT